MRRFFVCWGIAIVVAAVGACSGEVRTEGSSGSSADSGAGGSPDIDQACYDTCIAKGESPDVCVAYCGGASSKGGTGGTDGKGGTGATSGKGGTGGTGGSTGGTGGSTGGTGGSVGGAAGSTGGAAGSTGGTGGKPDPAVEKSCVQCWYDTQVNGACVNEAKACEESLACSQLQWCPQLCGKPDCVEECNQIIPTGVAPLTALVQCMACGNAPCASDCEGSVLLSYCD